MSTLFVGIDICQDSLDIALCSNIGKPKKFGSFSNQRQGFESLLEQLSQVLEEGQQLHVILEPTGGYEVPLAMWLYEQKVELSMPNPLNVRNWAKGIGYRAKTDKVDAKLLAHFGRQCLPPLWKPIGPIFRRLQSIVRLRKDLQQDLRRAKNRLHSQRASGEETLFVSEILDSQVLFLEEQIQFVEAELKELFRQNQELKEAKKRVLSVPGIGERTVAELLVFYARFEALTDGKGGKKALTAFLGLDPAPYQSGSSVSKRELISRKGDKKMRSALYIAALGGLRGDNVLREFYDRLVSRENQKK